MPSLNLKGQALWKKTDGIFWQVRMSGLDRYMPKWVLTVPCGLLIGTTSLFSIMFLWKDRHLLEWCFPLKTSLTVREMLFKVNCGIPTMGGFIGWFIKMPHLISPSNCPKMIHID